MSANSCLIVHELPIVHIGLRSLLQALRMEIREVMSEWPDLRKYPDREGLIILADVRHAGILRKEARYLAKQGISVVGLNFSGNPMQEEALFDEILNQNDNQNVLLGKLGRFSGKARSGNSSGQLSARELDILKEVARGLSNKEISDKLFISIHTVITHRKHITTKLGIKSISGLTLYAAIHNLIE